MITTLENGSIQIVVGNTYLALNGNDLTQADIDLITAYNPDNTEQVIAEEIKMRSIHKKIIAKNQFDLIEQMVGFDPNGWFIAYCTQAGITI